LFGQLLAPTPDAPNGSDVAAVASAIWVLGVEPLETAEPGLRASTAIDRTRAAVRVNTLRQEEVLPAGTAFEVYLRWDDPAESDLTGVRRGTDTVAGR
jgi:hypothetical protein